jgi:hypothetical protein
MALWHVTFLNDNRNAISGMMIEAPNRDEAHRKAGPKHPMGFGAAGPMTVRGPYTQDDLRDGERRRARRPKFDRSTGRYHWPDA